MATLYASFVDPAAAEKAAGALLDHGAAPGDLSILANEGYRPSDNAETPGMTALEGSAKHGISTTTGADAAMGAVKGSVVGVGVGALAAIASLLIPGVGLVIGGGALATALLATAGTAVAGAAAGGVAGFLKDQGVGDDYVTHYASTLSSGGCVLAVDVPTGDLSPEMVEQYLAKYGAANVSTTQGDRPTIDRPYMVSSTGQPGVESRPVEIAHLSPATELTTMTTQPINPGAVAAAVNAPDIEPLTVDPVTGTMIDGVAVDPISGVASPVHAVDGAVVYESASTLSPSVPGFTLADVVATRNDPATGSVSEGYVIDPTNGNRRDVRVVNGSIIYADLPQSAVVEESREVI